MAKKQQRDEHVMVELSIERIYETLDSLIQAGLIQKVLPDFKNIVLLMPREDAYKLKAAVRDNLGKQEDLPEVDEKFASGGLNRITALRVDRAVPKETGHCTPRTVRFVE